MNVVIDYLTMSSKIHSDRTFLQLLGVQDYDFIEVQGKYGWEKRHFYRGISAYYGGRDDFCLELSGTGCRTVEEISQNRFNWFGFLSAFKEDLFGMDVNISRLDIAADDREGALNYRTMTRHCATDRYICKARFRTWTDGDEQVIYFGSPTSARRLRIYNKAMEQKLGEDEHWLRVEMQMRDKAAVSFYLNWIQAHGDIGACYAGVLNDYIRFIKSPVQDNHYDRVSIAPWWRKFVGGVDKCKQLYLDGGHFDMWTVQHFLERQAASSLKLWLQANHGDMSDIVDMIEGAKLNKRQQDLLDRILSEEVKSGIMIG